GRRRQPRQARGRGDALVVALRRRCRRARGPRAAAGPDLRRHLPRRSDARRHAPRPRLDFVRRRRRRLRAAAGGLDRALSYAGWMDNPASHGALVKRWDSLPELEAVRVFAAVAELRTFRGTAAALGLPRSTVSRRLSALEESLGTRLLQRTTRHVSLTGAGEIFLAEIEPALARIGDAGQRMLDANAEPRGLVRMTAAAGVTEEIGGLLLELVERFPHVRVEIDFTDRTIDLVAEGYDLALRAGKLADSTLVSRPVGT